MKVSIFGLGYVGVVAAACFADAGHYVTGVDTNSEKVVLVSSGRSPIVEAGVDDLIKTAVAQGRLLAISDPVEAVATSDICLVCVGTPSLINGDLDLSIARKVAAEIGRAMKLSPGRRIILFRSTMLPGSMRGELLPILERESGLKAPDDFSVAYHPEFLREGSAVADFRFPPKVVFGGLPERDRVAVEDLYRGIVAPCVHLGLEEAEYVKYLDNVWHALKICFANEVAAIGKAHAIDMSQVMDTFLADRQLNISGAYLRPGFAFGGSCLPKDVKALTYRAKSLDVDIPVLSSILPSNRSRLEQGLRLVLARPGRNVAVLGFSFKAETDDLRESPMVELIELLKGKGYFLRIFDRNVSLSRLMGANLEYLVQRIPHVVELMTETAEEAVIDADIVILSYHSAEFFTALAKLPPQTSIIDLSGKPNRPVSNAVYVRII